MFFDRPFYLELNSPRLLFPQTASMTIETYERGIPMYGVNADCLKMQFPRLLDFPQFKVFDFDYSNRTRYHIWTAL